MVGQDPARFRRSTTATRFPCEASDQAKDLALPLPSTTTSYSSGCDTFFPLRVNWDFAPDVAYPVFLGGASSKSIGSLPPRVRVARDQHDPEARLAAHHAVVGL